MITLAIGVAIGIAARHYWPQPWALLWETAKAKLGIGHE